MSKRCVMWTAGCALAALILSLAGCAEFEEPTPHQPTMPETASWSAGDGGQSR